jgi:hypothetical protein
MNIFLDRIFCHKRDDNQCMLTDTLLRPLVPRQLSYDLAVLAVICALKVETIFWPTTLISRGPPPNDWLAI